MHHEIILPEGWDHHPFVTRKRMPRQGDGILRTGMRRTAAGEETNQGKQYGGGL